MRPKTSTPTVTLFRLAIARARRPRDHAKRLSDAVKHLEGLAKTSVRTHYDGDESTWMLVSTYRPVRFQAAKDIATTCPGYVAGSFKVLGD